MYYIHVLTQAYVVYLYFLDKSCFPSQTKIKLENGEIVTMSELQEGDKVQTGNKTFPVLGCSGLSKKFNV